MTDSKKRSVSSYYKILFQQNTCVINKRFQIINIMRESFKSVVHLLKFYHFKLKNLSLYLSVHLFIHPHPPPFSITINYHDIDFLI